MRDLDRALADIVAIRSHLAAGTAFRGYGPATMAATGGLALITATAQHLWLDANAQPLAFVIGWLATALVAAAVIGVEMRARSHRHHSGLADAMIHQAVEQFLPAAAAAACLAFVLVREAPEALWMLPGLWQLLLSLGIFASVRSLPRSVALAGFWYFIAGLGGLVLASDTHALSPWQMGLPFVVGQLLLAVLLHLASGEFDGEA
ncbi:MAG TPA: hypothetical protein VHW90_08075 [Stellaceae bacterium]|jgi:hypothetical protein|nr:hypothetical protein [Stellaceae bacterium]